MRLLLVLPLVHLHHCLPAQSLPSIEEKTKAFERHDGFFNFYWDENAGKVWLEIDKSDTEILYNVSLPAGVGSNDIGLDRGLLGESRIVKFVRTGRKILMIAPNYHYRAVTNDSNERRAVEESFAQSTLYGFTVEAKTGNRYLVDATDFLLRDAMRITSRLRSMRQGSYLLDKSRSAVYLPRCRNFPQNTELETSISFANSDGETGQWLQSVLPANEALTVRMHHSFIQLPDAGYEPRVFDPRSSFIDISFFDYSTPVAEPVEKHFVIRHRLQKKDPLAAKSEPVKPVVYYLDRGTPEPIRGALLEGARWWNQAFEAAGYINAFRVELMPESADPMDIRYNVINWVHRSTRGWSYGASVIDPRTGEIIKGHVTLGSLRVRQDYMIAQGLLAPFENGMPVNDRMLAMALDRLKQLAAHEVGHTLGLMHNYAASTVNRSSVMDYPHPLVQLDAQGRINLDQAYTREIGEWDKTAIIWGYQDFGPGATTQARLDSILSSAYRRGLRYISDRDARAPGGLHPDAHLWDNGSDPVAELDRVMKIRAKALQQFGPQNIRPGTPMAFLEDVLVPVYLYHRYQLEAVSKLVGGMQYSYALRGDGQTITKTLSRPEQEKALNAVIRCLAPESLALPPALLVQIPPRPAGYDYTRELFRKRTGLAFDALTPAESATDLAVSLLLNTERLNRMVEYQALYNGLGADEMLAALISATWKAPRKKGMEGLIQQQTEQILLTYLLAATINENTSFPTQAILQQSLVDLKNFIESRKNSSIDAGYKGHLLLALERIKKPENARTSFSAAIPPGAPIGCEDEGGF